MKIHPQSKLTAHPARKMAAILVSALFAPACLNAATTLTIGFDTEGDEEGFTMTNGSSGNLPLNTTGGFLTGTAGSSGDPRMLKAQASPIITKLTDDTWSTIVFRVRETADANDAVPGVITTFSNAGLAIVLSPNQNGSSATTVGGTLHTGVDSGDGFFTVTADISSYTQDDIRSFRIDPIGAADAANNFFEIDFIQINAIPEPSAALLGALGGLILLRRRR